MTDKPVRARRYRRARPETAIGATDPDSPESAPAAHTDAQGRPQRKRPKTARLRTDVVASLDHQPSRQRRRWEQRQRARGRDIEPERVVKSARYRKRGGSPCPAPGRYRHPVPSGAPTAWDPLADLYNAIRKDKDASRAAVEG